MNSLVATMLNRLDSHLFKEMIPWAAPVPYFGNLGAAAIATLGINPSNREFVDKSGRELPRAQRRFHTLNSFGLQHWAQAGTDEVNQIVESCDEYFFRNPYSSWFNRLNPIVGAIGCSYYDYLYPACHIDLLPFATDSKWGTLTSTRRRQILRDNADLLKQLIQSSDLELIILNGQSVVTEFVAITGVDLDAQEMHDWALPRAAGEHVPGRAYRGICDEIGGQALSRPLKILGFNHNIQSSFGVTSAVVHNIAQWVQVEGRKLEYA